jgi:hypothetical protein
VVLLPFLSEIHLIPSEFMVMERLPVAAHTTTHG